MNSLDNLDVDPVLTKITGSRALYLKRREILKFYKMQFLDNFKSLLFCYLTFGVRRSINVLDSENQPGSKQKEGFQNYLDYSFYKILKISLCSRYKALDPVFGQNRIHITGPRLHFQS